MTGPGSGAYRRPRRAVNANARVARAVQPLMVPGGDLAAAAERAHPGQHAVRQVGVQADPFGLGFRQRAWLVPDRVGDAQPAEVMDERRAPQRAHLVR